MSAASQVQIAQVTRAQVKLTTVLASSPSVISVARKVGVPSHNLKLLAAGLSQPRAASISKLQVLGIAPGDWFTAMPVDATCDELAQGTCSATTTTEEVVP